MHKFQIFFSQFHQINTMKFVNSFHKTFLKILCVKLNSAKLSKTLKFIIISKYISIKVNCSHICC